MKPDETVTEEELNEARELAQLLESPVGRHSEPDRLELLEFATLLRYSQTEGELKPGRSAELRRELCESANTLRSKQRSRSHKVWLRWAGLVLPAFGAILLLIQVTNRSQQEASPLQELASEKLLDDALPPTQKAPALERLLEVQASALAERSQRPLSQSTQAQLDLAWSQYRGTLLTQLEETP